MQEASFRRSAIAVVLVALMGGCIAWPGSEGKDLTLPWSKADSGLKLPSAADISAKLTGSTSVQSAPDPISLDTKSKPGPDLYLSAAQLSERKGRTAEAEQQYQKALRLDSAHAGALAGYARLKDRQGQLAEAAQLYQRAAKAEPKNASIFNDLGLCLAKQRKLSESLGALGRAVQLDPKKWLYRNNIAMVLVESGKVDAAVAHLAAVQKEAVAHYNVGFILQKKGNSEAAANHFAIALQKDPSLSEAQVWLAKLGRQRGSIAETAPRIASERQLGTPLPVASGRTIPPQHALQPPQSAADPIAVRRPAVQPTPRPAEHPPADRRLPPQSARPPVAEPAPGPSPDRPEFSNVAPLPPPTSVSQPRGTVGPSHSAAPLVHPLPQLTPQ